MPGEEKKVVFTITEQELRFLTEDGIYASEAGEFEIFIGKDSLPGKAHSGDSIDHTFILYQEPDFFEAGLLNFFT